MLQSWEQDEINRQEWENPDNWGGPAWMSLIYFSKKDTRRWVPHRKFPSAGWTPNYAHNTGVYWLCGVLISLPLFTALVCYLAFVGI